MGLIILGILITLVTMLLEVLQWRELEFIIAYFTLDGELNVLRISVTNKILVWLRTLVMIIGMFSLAYLVGVHTVGQRINKIKHKSAIACKF